MLYAFVVATVFIALAELGDKTQLLVVALSARFTAWQVLLGVLIAVLALMLVATAAGSLIGGLIPERWLGLATGVLFIGFGIWTLRGGSGSEEEEEAEAASARSSLGPVAATAGAFFLAELGDKTQIMAVAIAADSASVMKTFGAFGASFGGLLSATGLSAGGASWATFVGVWLGATLGMMMADGLAIMVGRLLHRALPARLIARVAGIIFIVFGVAALAGAALSWR